MPADASGGGAGRLTGVFINGRELQLVSYDPESRPARFQALAEKLILEDGSWVCYRLSGTEPVVRVYTEARKQGDSGPLSDAAKAWVLE